MPPLPGEIYYADHGNDESRRVLVVSRAELNHGKYVTVVPFTSKRLDDRKYLPNCVFFHANEFGLTVDCVVQADQIAAIPIAVHDQDAGCIGTLPPERLEEVHEAIKYTLAMD
jgi:mRNA-degrading endonuclease toxin of MazEF toxin-antitoxin module